MAKRILIVDDDADVREAFGGMLAERGYEISEAANGQEAFNKTQKEKPDIVLLDTILPYVDGNEICRQIKNAEGLNSKVIMYTGKVDAVDAAKAREAGADDYVVKTSSFSLLLEAIKKLT